jgi:hypothetical protein
MRFHYYLFVLLLSNDVVEYMYVSGHQVVFTAWIDVMLCGGHGNGLHLPPCEHIAPNFSTPRPPKLIPARFRGEATLIEAFTPQTTTTTTPNHPPHQHNTTTPPKHLTGPHRQNGTYCLAAALPSVLPQDCERRSRTQNRPGLSTTTPLSRDFFSVNPPVSPSSTLAHTQTRARKQTHPRNHPSHRPLTSHGPTGAKHKLQGGLLPLRQARQRPCRARRPGRSPQSMRPEPYSRRDQGPRGPDGRRL